MVAPVNADPDPVLARRARIARLVAAGKRLGYGLFGVAIAAFAVGVVTGPTPLSTGIVAGAIGVGSVVLAPAIVFGYGVKAAEREDRQAGRR
jgi:hypothetical protein